MGERKNVDKETANPDRRRLYVRVYIFFFFYLQFNLKAEVSVEIAQFHLVVKQHWVVAVLWRICSLGESETKEAGDQECCLNITFLFPDTR